MVILHVAAPATLFVAEKGKRLTGSLRALDGSGFQKGLEGNALQLVSSGRSNDRRPVSRRNRVSAMPLLHNAVIDVAIVGEDGAARPAVYEIFEAHGLKVRFVPYAVKTKRTGDFGTLCPMRKPDRTAGPFERLQWAREQAGYPTPREAAIRFAWNYNTYKSHENGARGLKQEAAERYAKAFKVSAAWLITGEGGENPKLTPDEVALLEKYRKLDQKGKEATQKLTDVLATPDEQPQKLAI